MQVMLNSSLFWDVTRRKLDLEDGTDKLSRNVINELPMYNAEHPRRTKISFTRRGKPEITRAIVDRERLIGFALNLML